MKGLKTLFEQKHPLSFQPPSKHSPPDLEELKEIRQKQLIPFSETVQLKSVLLEPSPLKPTEEELSKGKWLIWRNEWHRNSTMGIQSSTQQSEGGTDSAQIDDERSGDRKTGPDTFADTIKYEGNPGDSQDIDQLVEQTTLEGVGNGNVVLPRDDSAVRSATDFTGCGKSRSKKVKVILGSFGNGFQMIHLNYNSNKVVEIKIQILKKENYRKKGIREHKICITPQKILKHIPFTSLLMDTSRPDSGRVPVNISLPPNMSCDMCEGLLEDPSDQTFYFFVTNIDLTCLSKPRLE